MIKNFNSKAAQDIYDDTKSRAARSIPQELHVKIQYLLDQLNAITQVETLRKPPGNQLEKLKGKLKEYWSIRVNKQWRIIFIWRTGNAYNVDIVDYH